MAKFYIRMDTYWTGSPDTFFGPYPTRDAAAFAVDKSDAGRDDLGQMARDVKNQTRCLGVLTTTQAKRQGMRRGNTLPAVAIVPSTTAELAEWNELIY